MNCQSAREVFPALLDHRTAPTAHVEERAHLAACPDCQREFAALSQTVHMLDTLSIPPPSPRLRTGFYAILEEEKHSAASALAAAERNRRAAARHGMAWTAGRWALGPLAACGLVALGFVAGQHTATTTPGSASPADVLAMQEQVQQLQKEVAQMGTLVSYSLLRQQQRPANDRLRGVLTSAAQENPDEHAIQDLIGALAFDPSPNVRLRALEGLYPHAEHDVVRAGVVASLQREQNPLVQVAMIDFLTAANDTQARPALEKISGARAVDENVRTAAQRALAQL